MTELIGSFDVLNRRTRNFEAAELYRTISPQHVRDFEIHWRPAFMQRRAQMSAGETTESVQLQDSHWKWPEKAEVVRNNLAYESFAVVVGGITQGLLIVKMTGHLSRLAQPAQEQIPYLELIASAPWNRPGFTPTPQYKGIGELLLAAVVSLSVEEGFSGRLGLTAIPQSVDWYRDFCRFTELGPDNNHPAMIYFEATKEQAEDFINKRRSVT